MWGPSRKVIVIVDGPTSITGFSGVPCSPPVHPVRSTIAVKPVEPGDSCCWEPTSQTARSESGSCENGPHADSLATAEAVALERPEVDLELAREVFLEVATLLYNGLALDGLDEHDANAVVAGLCVDLVSQDPGAAVRARSLTTLEAPGDLHDPESVSASYQVAARILQL